jgi:hypothetical protein
MANLPESRIDNLELRPQQLRPAKIAGQRVDLRPCGDEVLCDLGGP